MGRARGDYRDRTDMSGRGWYVCMSCGNGEVEVELKFCVAWVIEFGLFIGCFLELSLLRCVGG